MDDPARPATGEPARIDTTPIPAVGRIVAHTLPATAVLVFAMPVALWWLLDTPSGELRTPWWPVLLLGLLVLFHVLARLVRAPRPTPPQVSEERLRSALVSTSRTGAVPADLQVRTAAGVTACQPIEAAVYAVAATAGVLIASKLVPQPAWIAFAVFAAGLAVVHLLRARHPWAYLRALRNDDHAD